MKNKIIALSVIFFMSFSANVIAEPLDTYEDSKVNEAYAELYELQQEAIELIEKAEDEITVSELESTVDSVTETLENNEQMLLGELEALEEDLQNEINLAVATATEEETINTAALEELIIEAENTATELNEQESENLEAVMVEATELLDAEPSQTEVDEMVVQLDQAIDAAVTIEETENEEVIDELITVVTKGDYDLSEANQMIQRLQNIAPVLYQGLVDSGVKMYLVNFPITELEQFADLAGEIPPGWEDEGKTWDDVPGAGGLNSVARIGYSEADVNNGHGSFNLELHEIAHPVDSIVLNNISSSSEFGAIHQEEQTNFLPDPYFTDPAEYFAEAFSYYFLNEESKNQLRVMAPRTYTFFQQISGEEQEEEPSIENLVQAIEEVRAMNDEWMTEELYNAFEFALVVRDNATSTQEEIDAAEIQLREAIQVAIEQQEAEDNEEKAEPSPIDKEELNQKIEEAVNIVKETSPASFTEALNNAYSISQDPNSTQAEVDNALENLASEIELAQSDVDFNSPQEEEDIDVEPINGESNSESESEDFIIASSTDNGSILPNTATNIFDYLFIGLTLIILGITTILSRKIQQIMHKDYLNESKFTISR